ncbi:MAG: DMT family transporter [Candidatus Azobacteroides sp.]|nr:DMT family transporter [Candidatus Azobacteroides sp.]
MWLALAFISAFLLGCYDVFKKISLTKNAVVPVLFLNTLFSSIIFLPFILISFYQPAILENSMLFVPRADLTAHLYIFIKACIVLSSWLFAYFAMKHLPLTITSPIKAAQPVLVLLGAMVFFSERLNLYQWVGVILALFSFFLLSKTGKKEGIHFTHNKWIFFIVLAIITGATSGLYDKYLLSRFDRMTVQVWYNFYQCFIMGIILIVLWYPIRKNNPFQWRWQIIFISVFLCMADFAYFYALSYPDAMISVVSMIRRSGVIVSFTAGALFFHEKNLKSKALDLFLVLLGMFFLYIGSK